MDLKQIESFVRVAELGSFTRSAAALGIPKPLLSRHVRQLEVELRYGCGVTLTARAPSCCVAWSFITPRSTRAG